MESPTPETSPEAAFRTGRHVAHLLHAHLVLTTKYRRGAETQRDPERSRKGQKARAAAKAARARRKKKAP